MWKELGYDFFKENKYSLLIYILVVIFVLPLEAIYLPELYGKIFDKIKDIQSFPSILDFTNNIKEDNFAGTLVLILFTWVILLLFGKAVFYNNIIKNTVF